MKPKSVEIDVLFAGARLKNTSCLTGHTKACDLFEAEHGHGVFNSLDLVRQSVKGRIGDAQYVYAHGRISGYDAAQDPRINIVVVEQLDQFGKYSRYGRQVSPYGLNPLSQRSGHRQGLLLCTLGPRSGSVRMPYCRIIG